MNIHREPFDLRSSLRSVTASLWNRPEDRELSHQYYVSVDEEASMQDTFQRSTQNMSFKDVLRSTFSGYVSEDDTQPPPSPSWGFRSGSSDSSRSSSGSFFRSVTQKLWNDEDDDMTTTCCPNLGLQQRLLGCACCFALGQLLQFFSLSSFASILMGRPGKFAFNFTMGNFFMLAASFFFSNPRAQCRKLKYKNRGQIFLTYVSAMVLTLFVVCGSPNFLGRGLLILVLVVLQWCALVWYVLSFVPYGHTVARKVLKGLARWCFAL
mmetsp:Transcript_12184/g.28418  ORF Transcript_12184/g.28418 Transcript_12184/m.28418 type:complete len:266 (+) Transcript_12184:140-937(+)|eukprot:CAMPEP_0178451874 /NCGR_PEP_ID=MMETSP0689_2-20121128/43930_1 /TAXON_ID=160604 /ORGANISM="Amphidinium massartii, Strain CS-259" /LENGTH=265 /DNA_ID=CAMNT_0020077515 /DNA_START=99 /DNA_END=896 /DNA_ORIENTATION=+